MDYLNLIAEVLQVLDAQGSSDNSMILVGGMDKQLTVFDVETGKITRRWRGHNGSVFYSILCVK